MSIQFTNFTKNILKVFLINLILFNANSINSQEIFDSLIVNFQEVLYFNSNKNKLSGSNIKELNTLISESNKFNNIHFFIDAHTDDQGSKSFNLDLSQKRGESVSNYLIQNGIDKAFITQRFHGENKLAVNKKDSLNRQINRRVVVSVSTVHKLINLTGQLIDEKTNENIQGNVEVQALNFNSIAKTNKNGYYKIAAPIDRIVNIDYSAENYFFDTKKIKINDSIGTINVPMKKAALGENLILKNMSFVGGMNILLSSSKPSFNRLLKFMKKNDKVCIELKGHINSSGNSLTRYMYEDIGVARALIIYEKLRMSGINENRILAKGYSDKFKIFPEPKSEKEMSANRRVEIEIVDCDIIAQDKNDTLKIAKYFSNIVENRKFNTKTFPSDFKHFFFENQSAILLKIRNLRNSGDNPSKYTYAELLNGGLDLKYKDNQVAMILRMVFDNDQFLREQTKKLESKYGFHSQELKEHWIKINEADSMNLIKVKKILDKNGWLGSEEISKKGNDALFLVIQHADLKSQLEYLPMMRKAIKIGNADGQDLALLEDRVADRQSRKQIYGSQILRDKESGEYYIAPLISPKSVNLRRKAIGLEKIEEYIKHWNLNWKEEMARMEKEN